MIQLQGQRPQKEIKVNNETHTGKEKKLRMQKQNDEETRKIVKQE